MKHKSLDPRVPARIGVVEPQHAQLEWQDASQEGSGHDHRLRCIPTGLGSMLQPPTNQGFMVNSGTHVPHQLPRVASSHTGGTNICQKQDRPVNPHKDRQHNSSSLHQSPGGNCIKGACNPDKGPMDVVSRTKHIYHSTTPSRCPEYNSRRRVSVSQGQSRLEIESSHIPKDRPHLWPTGDRSICHKINNSVPLLLQLAARSLCSVNRCISPDLRGYANPFGTS